MSTKCCIDIKLVPCYIQESMKFSLLATLTLLCLGLTGIAAEKPLSTSSDYPADSTIHRLYLPARPPLVPKPQKAEFFFQAISINEVSVSSPKPDATSYPEQMKFIRSELKKFLDSHQVALKKNAKHKIRFVPGKVKADTTNAKCQKEAYSIRVKANETTITAEDTRGFYYALQTLKQLIIRRDGKTTIPLCSIVDWPDFEVRGFTNDVGRNFMPLPLIKSELDSMALLKLNTYHFHFTEHPGWRLESKLYPELQDPKNFTRMPGKYYTQKEFVELVEYCRLRNILLVPEMDMPGHSGAFRKALNVKMRDEKATKALVALIKEMADLVPAEKMPIIHIGTDEVRGADEQVNEEILRTYFKTVEDCGRTPMRWQPGQNPKGYMGAIEHLWSGRQNRRAWPTPGAKYIDSLETYLNHIDPFEVPMTMYFRRPCPFQNATGLGMFLCSWPDTEITDPRNQVLHTPVYSGMAFVSEPLWNNPHEPVKGDPNADEYMKYFSNLPVKGDPLLKGFEDYEQRVLAVRDRFFVNKEFNYVRQSHINWQLLGPIPNDGKTTQEFGPETDARTGAVKDSYTINGKEYTWSKDEYTGATIIFKHYCDFPTLFNGARMGAYPHRNHTYYARTWIYSPKKQTVPFWIGAQTWATSDWRNGPVSVPGKWFHADPVFMVNGKEIPPPNWKKPHNNGPMVDENYHFRSPAMIELNKGWNSVLIKCPSNKSARRWMFTFVPVQINPKTPGCNVKEFPGLKFSATPPVKK